MNKSLPRSVKAAMNKPMSSLALLSLSLLACGGDPKVDTPEITQAESSFNEAVRTFCKDALPCYSVNDPDGVKYCEVPYRDGKDGKESAVIEEQHATGVSKCEKKAIADHTDVYLEALDCAKKVLTSLSPALESCPDTILAAEDYIQCFYPIEDLAKDCE